MVRLNNWTLTEIVKVLIKEKGCNELISIGVKDNEERNQSFTRE